MPGFGSVWICCRSKVVEIWGQTFYDGKPEEVTVEEDVYKTMSTNKYFECSKASDISEQEASKQKEDGREPHRDEHEKTPGPAHRR